MKGEEMNRDALIAILASIKQVAEANGEEKTKEHVETVLREIRQK